MEKVEKNRVFKNRECILTKVKKFIDEFLNPSDKVNHRSDMTVDDLLHYLHIDKIEYYNCLSVASGVDYEIHLKRPLNSCLINDHNPIVLFAWQADMDIQSVSNHHKCVTYLYSYMSKGETHCSEAIRVAAKEAKKDNLGLKDSFKKIGAAFLSSREVSSQECVYRCLPELWLRKTFPGTVFINTALCEQRVRTMKSKEQMAGLDDDSTDIFNSNIIERYSDRPDRNFMNGIYSGVENLFLAEFAAFYYKQYQTENDKANDNQPVVLSDDLLENQHVDSGYRLSKKIKLMTKRETMQCRKVRAVVRFHTPSKTTEPEKYCHHILMLYYP